MAKELKLGEDVIGRGCVVRGREVGIVVGRHVMSFLGSAAPTAAFVAITQTAGRTVLHRARPKRSGGRRAEAFLSREECRRSRQGKKAAGPPLPDRAACRPIAP